VLDVLLTICRIFILFYFILFNFYFKKKKKKKRVCGHPPFFDQVPAIYDKILNLDYGYAPNVQISDEGFLFYFYFYFYYFNLFHLFFHKLFFH